MTFRFISVAKDLVSEGMFRLFLSVVYIVNVCSGANILCVFQFPSLSHQIVFQPLWKALSLRGHRVTVVTPFPLADKSLINLTEIDVGYIKEVLEPSDSLQNSMRKDAPNTEMMIGFYKMSEKLQEAILRNSEFKKLYLNEGTKFDLVISEALHPGMYSLAGKFKAPVIGISSLGIVIASHESVGNPIHPVLYPDMNYAFHDDLTLREKLSSFYFSLWEIFYYNYRVIPKADAISRKYLGDDIPYLEDIGRNVDLIFINTNPIIYNVRPNIPTVIELGLMHLKPASPLPKDLQDILDEAENGVIYFSLGSNIEISALPTNLLKIITNDLSELPYTILWKWESDNFPDRSHNFVFRRWFPQQDVLAHPNLRGFITQGGLQSIEEAILNGVPMIGMPFFGDQAMNVKKLIRAGMGLELDPINLSGGKLKQAILEITRNKEYQSRVKEAKKILIDQPMTSVEKAVWWTEYVIRHNGTKHLRSPTGIVPWSQYFLLDILIVIFVTIVLMICLIYKFLRFTIKFLFCHDNLKIKVN